MTTLQKQRIIMVGNPNAGKTLLFNTLTGQSAKVANFPGITVEIHKGRLQSDSAIEILDLPGIYSLSPQSEDEHIARQELDKALNDKQFKSLLLAVVDATQLERSLFLVSQLVELGQPMVLALSMWDQLEQNSTAIDLDALQKRLSMPVVGVSSVSGAGLLTLVEQCKATLTATDVQFAQVEKLDKVESHYQRVHSWLAQIYQTRSRPQISDLIDRVALHKVLGPLVLVSILFLLFESLFSFSQPIVEVVDGLKTLLADWTRLKLADQPLLSSLLADGVINGVGSVLAFVPLIALLFLFLTALEDSGYMARAVFLLNRIMSRVGLSGKAFVPLVSGFACAVPAILSTRIIESRKDRIATILVTPLMSCSARLPVYGLLIAAAFSGFSPVFGFVQVGALIMVGMYLLGIVAAFLTALVLRRFFIKGKSAPLIMELPPYRLPRPLAVWGKVKSRVSIFIKEAGTVILAMTILLWGLFTFPRAADHVHPTHQEQSAVPFAQIDQHTLESSYAGQLGHAIEPLIAPLGFDWKIGVGLLASFAAREVMISTLGMVYGLSDVDESSVSLKQALQEAKNASGERLYSPAVALSLMVFFALSLQCMSTFAATRKETGGFKWPLIQLGYLNVLAWLSSFMVFQTGRWLGF